jgi:hypothetical protein
MIPLHRSVKITGSLLAGLCILPLASHAAPIAVDPGYDLFTTQPGSTTFLGQSFGGVPLGTFDFGGSIGVKNTGTADTIVQRLGTASVAGFGQTAAPIALQIDALQLESTAPFDPDGPGPAPFANYFVTLQSARGGQASTGQMSITFNSTAGGTFVSDIHVFFDIREGSLTGPIVMSQMLDLAATTSDWTHAAPLGATIINGVDHFLNTIDISNDFWGIPQHNGPHGVSDVPEPGAFAAAAGLGLLGFGIARRRRA